MLIHHLITDTLHYVIHMNRSHQFKETAFLVIISLFFILNLYYIDPIRTSSLFL